MKEIKPSQVIFYIVLFGVVFLLEKLFSIWIEKEIWSIGLSFLVLFILIIGAREVLNKYSDQLDDKIEEDFDQTKWFNRLRNTLAIIGIIWIVSFISDKKSYEIKVIHPEEKQLELVVKDNWGLKVKSYEIKYINREWKYKNHFEGKSEWISLPEVKDIYDEDYLISYTY